MSHPPKLKLTTKEIISASAVERAASLNTAFGNGASVWTPKLLKLTRAIKHPVIIDFNGVLVSDREPLTANPEAEDALKRIRSIGTVVVATVATNAQAVRDTLITHRLWHPEMVVMAAPNFTIVDTGDPDPDLDVARMAEIEYIELLKNHGLEVPDRDGVLSRVDAAKRIGPVFMRTGIPIIDDAGIATYKNPGMVGLFVDRYTPHPQSGTLSQDGMTLAQAAEAVVAHYAVG